MPIYSNEGGVLYELDNVYSNDGGTLYDLDTVHSNEGGVLYEIFSASSPTHVKWTANTSADSDAKIVSTTSDGLSVVFNANSHVYGQYTGDNDRLSIVSKPFKLVQSTVVGLTINSFSSIWSSRYGMCKLIAFKKDGASFTMADYVSYFQRLKNSPQSCGVFANMQLEPGTYYFCLQACSSYSSSFSTGPNVTVITADITISYPDSYNSKYHYQQ
mgnify:CR=1 FL=1|nr:MAG TPA: hypothetical protein [Caudoviricetes sp.]